MSNSTKQPTEVIDGEVVELFGLQHQIATLESELMANDKFCQFLELQKQMQEETKRVWAAVEPVAVALYKKGKIDKTTKFDWGSLTIREDTLLDINEDELPPRFWKKVPDTTKIRTVAKLEGKAPKGVKTSTSFKMIPKVK